MPNKPSKAPKIRKSAAITIVGVGASAGGLEAFELLLGALPVDSEMAFVLVQHLAPKHESILAELLRKATKMPVIEVTEGVSVRPNHVYVIPPNAEMAIAQGTLHLSPLSDERTRRMPIDFFLRSLAEDQQGRAIGVILSGTASDGTMGLQAIKSVGGVTFAQDEQSAKYSGMPRSAVAAGVVDFVLPPDMIARELTRIAKHVQVFASDDSDGLQKITSSSDGLNKILLMLKNAGQVDFSHYKQGTIKRRVVRRMFLRKVESLAEYERYLRKHPEEIEILFNDVLINVTSFFRDPESFAVLRKCAFPAMTAKAENSTIRVWVPGCSTGEEAYSLAIALLEYVGDQSRNFQIQVFATDLSEAILQKARLGMYPESIALDVSANLLRRFFQKANGGYQISKTIRDICVFAKQDISKDPPFSKLDLISCRNVMIYMGPLLQKRIVPMFHYALNPGGILFLGSSETVGNFGELFTPLDKKYKIYSKKGVSPPLAFNFMPQLNGDEGPRTAAEIPRASGDIRRTADQILLNRYVPPSVVVNEKLDIIQFIGQTGPFLEPAPGDASLNLLKMVKQGLHGELRLAFQKLQRGGASRKENVLIEANGGLKSVAFEILPIKSPTGDERYYLVIFEENRKIETKKKEVAEPKGRKKLKGTADISEHKHLKAELEATREYLQSIIEEQRTTNEELRSANEEIQSSNEELQSINEELETAKEELQSTNEELTTVNEELRNRNDELTILNSDLNNVLGSVNIPIIMLTNDLRVRRFTPASEKVMNLIPADIGRPITDIKPAIKFPNMREVMSRVLETLEIREIEVENENGKWYSMKIRPYRTIDNKIDGVVMLLLDLDKRLHPENKP